VSWITAGSPLVTENCPVETMETNMIDHCLSALATAWLITFIATTGLVTALAMESVWDREVYSQVLQDVVTPDPL
jgi:hypothetical protein